MILFVDTETTGLPLDYSAPPSATSMWPRLVEISWLLYDEDGNEVESASYIIFPSGFRIPEEATLKHGISDDRARSEGVPLEYVLRKFYGALCRAELLVGHNIGYDVAIIAAEFYRLTIPRGAIKRLLGHPTTCTMRSSTEFCALPKSFPGGGEYKWPKLEELHEKLFGEVFTGSHRAAADVAATARCYFELRRQGIVGGRA